MLAARPLLCASLLAALTACGGGDVDVLPEPPPAPRPQGLWNGSTGAGSDLRLLVTDEHVVWGIYQPVGSTQVGFVHAPRLNLQDQRMIVPIRDFAPGNTVGNGELSAVVANRATLRGQTYDTGRIVPFQADYDASFETQASDAALAGIWAGTDRDGNPVTLTITSTGAFAGSTTPRGGTAACTFRGNARHRDGRGYYVVSVSFDNTNACLLPGQIVTGIGLRWQTGADAFLGTALLTGGGDQGVASILTRQPTPPAPAPAS